MALYHGHRETITTVPMGDVTDEGYAQTQTVTQSQDHLSKMQDLLIVNSLCCGGFVQSLVFIGVTV